MRRAQSRDPGPLTLRTRAGSHPVLDAEKAGHRTGPRVKVSPPGAHAGQQVSAGQRYEQVSRVGREHSYEGQEPQVPKSGGSGEVFLEELSRVDPYKTGETYSRTTYRTNEAYSRARISLNGENTHTRQMTKHVLEKLSVR